ncbi:MAG: hypothetical protein EAS51_04040 [Microbacteriaceae bacterium]|nr:MAG: hypothetical protein EAS51_04040 [Microbacteriaceae bacterium]
MLAAMEDLLDSWPGTLLVVSHDRYLLERVTDQQYAVIGGRMRHLPGGVDEYLRLRASAPTPQGAGFDAPAGPAARPAGGGGSATARPAGGSALSGAERRAAEKELASVERRMAKVGDAIVAQHAAFAAADQSDYAELQRLQAGLAELEAESAALEERWLELGVQLEG